MTTRIALDLVLLGNLFFLMSIPYTHKGPHVMAGMLFFLLLVIHHVVNIRWARSLSSGRWNRKRMLETCTNGALAVVIVLLFYSSLFIMAKHGHWPITLPGTRQLAAQIHMLCAYWGFLLMSFHLGLHGQMLISLFKKYISSAPKARMIASGLLWALAVCGVYAFISLHWIDYLFLLTHFMEWDQDMSGVVFVFGHAGIMALAGKIAWAVKG